MRKLKKNEILVLRVNDGNNASHDGQFTYPKSGYVEAPDWEDTAECGRGLHGLPRGVGGGSLLNWKINKIAMLLVVNNSENYHEFEGKCKFKGGEIVFMGSLDEAVSILQEQYPDAPIVYAHKQGGYFSTLTGGDYSTLTGGYGSTLTGGDRSTLIGGYRSTLTGGDYSTLTGRDGSTLTWKIWDGNYYRLHTFYVGEDGIKPNTPYRFEEGQIVEVVQ
jgi:hypothetical protein